MLRTNVPNTPAVSASRRGLSCGREAFWGFISPDFRIEQRQLDLVALPDQEPPAALVIVVEPPTAGDLAGIVQPGQWCV